MKKMYYLYFWLIYALGCTNAPQPAFSQTDNITAVKMIETTGKVIAGYDSGKIELWDMKRGIPGIVWTNTRIAAPIIAVYFVKPYQQIMVAYRHLGIVFIDMATGKESKIFAIDFKVRHKDVPEVTWTAAFHEPTMQLAVAGDLETAVAVIDIDLLYRMHSVDPDTAYYVSVKDWLRIFPEPDSTSLVYTIFENQHQDSSITAYLYQNVSQAIYTTLKFTPDGRSVWAGSNEGKLIRWELPSGDDKSTDASLIIPVMTARDQTEFKDILGIDMMDSTMISVSFHSRKLSNMQVWKLPEASLITSLEGDPTTCRNIKFRPKSNVLVTTGDFYYRWMQLDGDTVRRVRDFYYGKSVGYDSKRDAVDISSDGVLALADAGDVFFYRMQPFRYLYSLRGNEQGLKVYERSEE